MRGISLFPRVPYTKNSRNLPSMTVSRLLAATGTTLTAMPRQPVAEVVPPRRPATVVVLSAQLRGSGGRGSYAAVAHRRRPPRYLKVHGRERASGWCCRGTSRIAIAISRWRRPRYPRAAWLTRTSYRRHCRHGSRPGRDDPLTPNAAKRRPRKTTSPTAPRR